MLIEVLVSIILLSLVGSALVNSVVISRRLNYANAQRVAAFGLAQARLEELKGIRYDEIDPADFPKDRQLEFAQLGGIKQKKLKARRITTLSLEEDPERMAVTVKIRWKFRGQAMEEKVSGILYPR